METCDQVCRIWQAANRQRLSALELCNISEHEHCGNRQFSVYLMLFPTSLIFAQLGSERHWTSFKIDLKNRALQLTALKAPLWVSRGDTPSVQVEAEKREIILFRAEL